MPKFRLEIGEMLVYKKRRCKVVGDATAESARSNPFQRDQWDYKLVDLDTGEWFSVTYEDLEKEFLSSSPPQ